MKTCFRNIKKYLNDKLNIKYNEKVKKLILDLLPKKNYKVYYKNLEYYLKLGLKVTKVHIIIEYLSIVYTLAQSKEKETSKFHKDLLGFLGKGLFRSFNDTKVKRR